MPHIIEGEEPVKKVKKTKKDKKDKKDKKNKKKKDKQNKQLTEGKQNNKRTHSETIQTVEAKPSENSVIILDDDSDLELHPDPVPAKKSKQTISTSLDAALPDKKSIQTSPPVKKKKRNNELLPISSSKPIIINVDDDSIDEDDLKISTDRKMLTAVDIFGESSSESPAKLTIEKQKKKKKKDIKPGKVSMKTLQKLTQQSIKERVLSDKEKMEKRMNQVVISPVSHTPATPSPLVSPTRAISIKDSSSSSSKSKVKLESLKSKPGKPIDKGLNSSGIVIPGLKKRPNVSSAGLYTNPNVTASQPKSFVQIQAERKQMALLARRKAAAACNEGSSKIIGSEPYTTKINGANPGLSSSTSSSAYWDPLEKPKRIAHRPSSNIASDAHFKGQSDMRPTQPLPLHRASNLIFRLRFNVLNKFIDKLLELKIPKSQAYESRVD